MRPWRYNVTMIPCALRTCLQWLIVTVMGRVSPGSTPARKSSAFAVMVLSEIDGVTLRPSLFCPVLADELGSLAIRKLWLLSLGRLDELTLLGEGLSGGLVSTDGAAPLIGVSIEDVSGAAVASEFVDLAFPFGFERLEIGSNVTIRALGAGKGAISIFSRRLTRLRHVRVGFMVVGRVRVEVSE